MFCICGVLKRGQALSHTHTHSLYTHNSLHKHHSVVVCRVLWGPWGGMRRFATVDGRPRTTTTIWSVAARACLQLSTNTTICSLGSSHQPAPKTNQETTHDRKRPAERSSSSSLWRDFVIRARRHRGPTTCAVRESE